MKSVRIALIFGIFAAACASEDVGKTEHALSHAGPWSIPADTLAIGDDQDVTYTGAGPWTGTSACSGSLTAGAGTLRDWLMVAFPQITSIGGYSCRHINGDSTQTSVHATGRALDIFIPLHAGDADNDLGDPLANWLIEHAEEIGIQFIIWDRWTWGAHRADGDKSRSYGGAHPHHDHLHVELSVQAGDEGTAWFSGPRTLPHNACGDLGPDGGEIEETGDCFAAFGPAAYWRHETGAGHGGSLLWTNAFQNDAPSNWARWSVNPTTAGDYTVEVYADPAFAVNRATRYEVRHGTTEHGLEVDLAGASGWIALGTFRFDAGGGQHVSVFDNTTTAVGSDEHIPADAIRLTRVTAPDPDPDPDPTPGPRTVSISEIVYADIPAIEGGDPTIDDDPRDDRRLTGGCSVSLSRSSGASIFFGLGLLVVVLRRRRSRRAPIR